MYIRPIRKMIFKQLSSLSFAHNANTLMTNLIAVPVYGHYIHTSFRVNAVNKVDLSKLRKQTGFSISHCKKALELHESDLQKAEEWLKKEAQAHGWAKATKLSGRATTQGLIGVHIQDNVGVMVEVNCETDFVSQNADFHSLVSQITKGFASSISCPQQITEPVKETVCKEVLERVQVSDGQTLSDLIALSIGKIGENIKLSRGIKFISPPGIDLVGYAHPSAPDNIKMIGKYGAVTAFKNTSNKEIIRELCAHIVGLNPLKIGSLDDLNEEDTESPVEDATKSPVEDATKSPVEDATKSLEGIDDVSEEEVIKPCKEEETLIRQEFLGDQDKTVGEVLKENNIEVIDFVRMAVGETRIDS